jgi:predicted regulator of Ras-like GTPase activity (Roadblock/LC7/MglB family)
MADVGTILENLILSVKGLEVAFVAGTDGFMDEGRAKDENTDLETIAGLVMPSIVDLANLSGDLDYGRLGMAMVEYQGGVIIATPVNSDLIWFLSLPIQEALQYKN